MDYPNASLTRRSFLKGLALAGVALSFPIGTLAKLADAGEQCDISFLYVTPGQFTKYEKKLYPQQRFTNAALAKKGFDNLMFKSYPLMPYKGRITYSGEQKETMKKFLTFLEG